MSKSIQELNNAKFNRWLENKQIYTIDSSLIELTENMHNKGHIKFTDNYLNKYADNESITRIIVIKPYGGGYSLVRGWKWLMLAKALNKPVNAVIVGKHMNHDKFNDRLGLIDGDLKIPEDTEMVYPIHKVIVPKYFVNSNPSIEKVARIGEYFIKNGCIDKSITVKQDKHNRSKVVLQDEYARFNLLKVLGIKYIPVKFKKES